MKLVAYLAAPVTAPTFAGIESNLASASAWLRWFVDNTPWAVSAPWMPYVETLAEETYRERGLVGGRVSSGMAMERAHAIEHGLAVLDLTMFAAPPVAPSVDQAHAVLACRRIAERITAARIEARRAAEGE